MNIVETLQSLCAIPAVSGWEVQAAERIQAYLRPYCDTVSADAFGNVYGFRRCANDDAPTVLLDAHFDQIGFLVTEVLDHGFLRFASVGGVDPRMLLGNEVTILADTPLHGVIACMPPHLLQAGEANKAVSIDQMWIDTGLLNAKDQIRVGTPVVFAQEPALLSNHILSSKCLDDRAGIAAIFGALELLQEPEQPPLAYHVAVLISAQEEVTGLGASIGTFAIQPQYGIAIDVTHGKTPDGPSEGVFELGSGVSIGMGPNLNRALTQALIKTAKAEDIPYTQEVMEGNTGTNAWTMQIVAQGVAMGLLSIPQRYMHTPIETIDTDDVHAVSKLIAAFLRSGNGGRGGNYGKWIGEGCS